MIPTREIYWNVAPISQAAMYLLLAVPAFFLAYGIASRYLVWRQAQSEGPLDHLALRLKTVLAVLLLHRRILRGGQLYAGIMHLFIFWGFVILFVGTVLVMIQADFTGPYLGLSFLKGDFYVGYKLFLNLFGLLFIVGVLMGLLRRFWRPSAPFRNQPVDDLLVLWTLLALGATGFLLQGLRLAATSDPFASIHWVSYPLVSLLVPLGTRNLQLLHAGVWWFHMAATMAFLAYIVHSKMFHILAGPASLFVRSLDRKGTLAPIPGLEERESFGAGKLTDFDWKQLLHADACMRCARCLNFCPTYNTGKPLQPRQLILKLAGLRAAATDSVPSPLSVISEEEIWDCTTCRACMEQCPVMIEHVPLVVEMRRHLVMEQGEFPPEMNPVFTSLEQRGNPFRLAANTRGEWAKELDVPVMAEVANPEEIEILYFVGCRTAYDPRSQKIARSMVKILRAAGIRFAILGNEERCCGDLARRAGNEYLYQTLAQQNIDLLNGYRPKRILTACPHGFNTLKNEYAQSGGNYEVIHHSQLIEELLDSGRLKLREGIKHEALTYHDPCYLGRYNDVYDAPRRALTQINGDIIEMPRSRERSFCCGAGGGHAFLEERRGTRVSHNRLKEAVATGADTVVVACPFCMMMLEDGLRGMDLDESHRVADLAEVVAEALATPQ